MGKRGPVPKLLRLTREDPRFISDFAVEVRKGILPTTVGRSLGILDSAIQRWLNIGRADLKGLSAKDEGGVVSATGDPDSVFARFALAVDSAQADAYGRLEDTLDKVSAGELPNETVTVTETVKHFHVLIRAATEDQDAVYEEKTERTITKATRRGATFDGQSLRFALARKRPKDYGAARERDEIEGDVTPEQYGRAVASAIKAMDATIGGAD